MRKHDRALKRKGWQQIDMKEKIQEGTRTATLAITGRKVLMRTMVMVTRPDMPGPIRRWAKTVIVGVAQ